MSFFDKVMASWSAGIDGNPELNLREGINSVFKVAEKAEEMSKKQKAKDVTVPNQSNDAPEMNL